MTLGKSHRLSVDHQPLAPWGKGKGWAWFASTELPATEVSHVYAIAPDSTGRAWTGEVTRLVVYDQAPQTREFAFSLKSPLAAHPLPPRPLPAGIFRTTVSYPPDRWE